MRYSLCTVLKRTSFSVDILINIIDDKNLINYRQLKNYKFRLYNTTYMSDIHIYMYISYFHRFNRVIDR